MSTSRLRQNRGSNGHGGFCWIRREKRLAIYLRDGLACCWCRRTIEDGARLTLDHLIPRAQGGTNEASNLFTSCLKCNSKRGDMTIAQFSKIAGCNLFSPADCRVIVARIRATVRRPIDIGAAKELIRHRGSFLAALAQSA